MSADYKTARAAQLEVRDLLKGRARLAGIGLTESDGDYAVKVNLIDACGVTIPRTLNGIDIVIEEMDEPSARVARRLGDGAEE